MGDQAKAQKMRPQRILVEYILWRWRAVGLPVVRMTSEARRLIAKNVRALRTAKKMTQEDLAGAAEIDRSYVSLIENAHYSVSIDLLAKMAEVFGIALHEMLHPNTAKRVEQEKLP